MLFRHLPQVKEDGSVLDIESRLHRGRSKRQILAKNSEETAMNEVAGSNY
jgi:hypothetical protein